VRWLTLPTAADATTRRVVESWNLYSDVLLYEAARLEIDPGVALAVLLAETMSDPFGPDERMIIRFENHIFYDKWGKANEERFRQYFIFDPQSPWLNHQWRPDPQGTWQQVHLDQESEWQVLSFARQLDEQAALAATSMGLAQIMGFNHAMAGYTSPSEMFSALQESPNAQLHAFFRVIEGLGLVTALRQEDFAAFAEVYNDPDSKQAYADLIQKYLAAYQALQ
jgi:hypothetical protein